MTSNLFNAGDMQRLERDEMLDVQAERQEHEEDRTPCEILDMCSEPEHEMNESDVILAGILDALQKRI